MIRIMIGTKSKSQFELDKARLEENLELYRENLEKAKVYLERVRRELRIDMDEKSNADMAVERWRYAIQEAEAQLRFLRPNNEQDIEYRQEQFKNFGQRLSSVIPITSDLRFHGTPIYFAEQIIKSGVISSSADRYNGYIKSTDPKGEISASTIKSIGRTIMFYSDISAYQHSMPCGCIFVLQNKDKKDKEIQDIDLMKTVNLRKHPEQLVGIITSPENIERVQGWLEEAEFDPTKAYTYESFIEYIKEQPEEIIQGTSKDNNTPFKIPSFDLQGIEQIAQGRSISILKRCQDTLKRIFEVRGRTDDKLDAEER